MAGRTPADTAMVVGTAVADHAPAELARYTEQDIRTPGQSGNATHRKNSRSASIGAN
jgi:hypothetical protein